MKYANTYLNRGIEVVLVVLPLSSVPAFNAEAPPPQSYLVPDEVQPGWVCDTGVFRPQTTQEQRKLSVPARVTEFQAKAALMQTAHLSGKSCYAVVEEYMTSPTADPMIVLAWKTCRDYERLDNKIQFIAQNVLQFPLETIDTQLDNLFILAKTIH